MQKAQLKAGFQEKLNLFCFFHLGSDAHIELEEQGEELVVSVKHHRVEPFEFAVSYAQLEKLLQDSPALERFMLEEVTPHRK